MDIQIHGHFAANILFRVAKTIKINVFVLTIATPNANKAYMFYIFFQTQRPEYQGRSVFVTHCFKGEGQ